jgi:hypothetical protein
MSNYLLVFFIGLQVGEWFALWALAKTLKLDQGELMILLNGVLKRR